MANVPIAGVPDFSSVHWGKGKALPKQQGLVANFHGFDKLEEALGVALLATPKALAAGLTELGHLGLTETKLRTPVHYGVLRASEEVVDLQVHPMGECSVTWGTNVEYGPWIEWGFTMRTRRAVYFPGVGFRMVNPFTYRGAHMFELGLERASTQMNHVMEFWAAKALTAGGLELL